ncbi:hypothetical protein ABKV19_004523 [Rosa sericea]
MFARRGPRGCAYADPERHLISPKEYQSFRIGSNGNLQGVGLFVGTEPRTGHLVVMSCVDGSPAARAGIHEGDELVEINGSLMHGVDTEAAVQKLRGHWNNCYSKSLTRSWVGFKEIV